nr:hypothetical protein [Sphingomonas sp.]
MRRGGVILAGAALVALTGSAGAETPSGTIDVAHQMDRYVGDPRGPGTYRALAGLGDPSFEPESRDSSRSWQQTDSDQELFGLDYSGDCRPVYALKSYRERVTRLGEHHPYVTQWLKVQRAVFSPCKNWNPDHRNVEPLPPPLPLADTELDRLQRADRAYQIASQLFYRSKIVEARSAFAAIAAQKGPHQPAAIFMLAAIDGGSTPVQYPAAKPRPGAVAEAKALLSNPKMAGMRVDAHELIGWMGATHDTRETRAAQIAVTLQALHLPLSALRSDGQARARYDRSAEDLPALWTKFENSDWWLTGAIPKDYFGSLAMAEAAKHDRLAAYQMVPAPCRSVDCHTATAAFSEYIGQRLKDSAAAGDRDAWRVADIELSGSYGRDDNWAEIDRLIAQVQRSPTDHDVALLILLTDQQLAWAFEGRGQDNWRADRLRGAALMQRWPWPQSQWFVQRYSESLRTLAGGGFVAEARALRDRVGRRIPEENHWGVPGELLLLLAEDRDHFVRALVENKQYSSALIDRLPIGELEILARDSRVPVADRARFARVAWTRAYLIDRRIPKKLDQLMRALNPEVVAAWRSKLGARTDDHALLLDVLRSPGMNLRAASRADEVSQYGDEATKPTEIDVYQHSLNNWWCGPIAADFNARDEEALSGALTADPREPEGRAEAEKMLAQSWVWQALDGRERAALGTRPMAPRMLAEGAVVWGAKANPSKPDGADEALALAIRATRYGCQFQGGHGRWSKAAWDLLHQRFPNTDAAHRTRWWFDCKHFTYGCTDSTKDDQAFIPYPDEPAAPETESAPPAKADEAPHEVVAGEGPA